jgi:ABC-2 type transport system permease protein
MEDAFIAIVERARSPPSIAALIRGRSYMSATSSAHASRLGAKLRRITALVRKETYQLFRDPSSIAIGIAMPLLLILLFGYALSLDVNNVPVAVVLEESFTRGDRSCGKLHAFPLFRHHAADRNAACSGARV